MKEKILQIPSTLTSFKSIKEKTLKKRLEEIEHKNTSKILKREGLIQFLPTSLISHIRKAKIN